MQLEDLCFIPEQLPRLTPERGGQGWRKPAALLGFPEGVKKAFGDQLAQL